MLVDGDVDEKTTTSIVILGDIGKVVSVGPVDVLGIVTIAPHLEGKALEA